VEVGASCQRLGERGGAVVVAQPLVAEQPAAAEQPVDPLRVVAAPEGEQTAQGLVGLARAGVAAAAAGPERPELRPVLRLGGLADVPLIRQQVAALAGRAFLPGGAGRRAEFAGVDGG